MKYHELKKMKKKYPSFKDGKRTCLLDLELFNSLNEQKDAGLAAVLDEGYGKAGTIARLKVEFQRKVEQYPTATELIGVSFADPVHTFYMEVESERVYVYDQETGKQAYVFIRPYAYRLTVYKNGAYEAPPVYSEICGRWSASVSGDVKEAFLERRPA
jgi:hypothetical protein